MSLHGWMTLFGALFLLLALSSALLRRLPISSAIVYLALGMALGPAGAGVLGLDVVRSGDWVEGATEIAVIVSLFVGGLRLRLPLRHGAWRAAYRLAGPVMLATIACVALVGHLLLGLDVATALLLGAILAPTDPVLAGAVSVGDAADHDRMRYGLSGEAGLNDGMAFPFVILALEWAAFGGPGEWIWEWLLREIVWAIPVALLTGLALGRSVGRLAILLRSRMPDITANNDFLALALIALSYVGAEALNSWGFLAVFAAGVGLRHAEVRVRANAPDQGGLPAHARRLTRRPSAEDPAEHLVRAPIGSEALQEPTVAAGVLVSEILSFGITAERILEVLLVSLVGVLLVDLWDPRALAVAAALFLVIRPLATYLLLAGTPTSPAQRLLMGWFGIRGIGSLYYLAYALQHGVTGAEASTMVSLTISVIALSVVLHGISAQPVLDRYSRALAGSRPELVEEPANEQGDEPASEGVSEAPERRGPVPGEG